LTGEKCLRRRRAKNHVVGFRECYWFSVRKCSREGKKNGRRFRVDRLVVFLPFERSRLVLWPISSGLYSMENITLGHRLASRFQPVFG